METEDPDLRLAEVARAIAEPARARMLCALLDGHARTGTELAVIGEIGPPTASAHLARLKALRLVEVVAQGKHRYYRLAGASVAAALEALLVVAAPQRRPFTPNTPPVLRAARTCYDHMAGALAVRLHDRMLEDGLLLPDDGGYALSAAGAALLESLGADVGAARARRRRFACGCLDWSERRPHLGGALGAALLDCLVRHAWVERALDSRALTVTRKGRRRLAETFGIAP